MARRGWSVTEGGASGAPPWLRPLDRSTVAHASGSRVAEPNDEGEADDGESGWMVRGERAGRGGAAALLRGGLRLGDRREQRDELRDGRRAGGRHRRRRRPEPRRQGVCDLLRGGARRPGG